MSVPGRTLMFVENFFPQDTRVANEANLLVEAGYQVSVICLRKSKQSSFEIVNGVNVYRVPRFELFKKTAVHNASTLDKLLLPIKTLIGYLSEYFYFTSMCFWN